MGRPLMAVARCSKSVKGVARRFEVQHRCGNLRLGIRCLSSGRQAIIQQFLDSQPHLEAEDMPPRIHRAVGSTPVPSTGSSTAPAPNFSPQDGLSSEQAFSRIYGDEEWVHVAPERRRDGEQAMSGLGSREDTTREFRAFLEEFLRTRGITSVVDAGCGHWPSGYQRFMHWQGVHYTGIDVVPTVAKANAEFLARPSALSDFGMRGAVCFAGDVGKELPAADVLIVKDVLMHLPSAHVHAFLESSIFCARPRYKAVLVVQNEVPATVNLREMMDIEAGQFLPFDITQPPFNAPLKRVFGWQSDELKSVHLWEP